MSLDLSIICPMYNEVEVAKSSLVSILKQVEKFGIKAELIVVDDCSTDGGFESLADLAGKIHLYRTDINSGSGGIPRNFGIQKAIGRYMMFYDMGDELLLDDVQQYISFMDDFGINIVVFNHQDEYPGNKIFNTPIKIFKDQVYQTTFKQTPHLISNPFSWGKLYRTEWLIENNIYFGRQYSGQDKVFTWKSYLTAENIIITPSVMYRHRFFDESRNRMLNINSKVVDSLIQIDADISEEFRSKGMDSLYFNRLINRDFLGILLSKNGVLKLVKNQQLFEVMNKSKDFLNKKMEDIPNFRNSVNPQLGPLYFDLVNGDFGSYLTKVLSN